MIQIIVKLGEIDVIVDLVVQIHVGYDRDTGTYLAGRGEQGIGCLETHDIIGGVGCHGKSRTRGRIHQIEMSARIAGKGGQGEKRDFFYNGTFPPFPRYATIPCNYHG